MEQNKYGALAQLLRVSDCLSEGHRLESDMHRKICQVFTCKYLTKKTKKMKTNLVHVESEEPSEEICSVRLGVRTTLFRSADTGSIPVPST